MMRNEKLHSVKPLLNIGPVDGHCDQFCQMRVQVFSQNVDVIAIVTGLFVVNDLDGVVQIVIKIKIVVARGDGGRERKEEENVNIHFNFDFDAPKSNDENSEKAVKFILILFFFAHICTPS